MAEETQNITVGLEAIPNFNGTSNVDNFIEYIEITGLLTKWNDEQKVAIARLKVQGLARKYLNSDETIKTTKDWAIFSKNLKSQFKEKKFPGQDLRNFIECRQQYAETCWQFLTEIKNLGMKIKVTSNDKTPKIALNTHYDKVLLQNFMLGLIPEIKDKVLTALRTDLNMALNLVEIQEMIFNLNKK